MKRKDYVKRWMRKVLFHAKVPFLVSVIPLQDGERQLMLNGFSMDHIRKRTYDGQKAKRGILHVLVLSLYEGERRIFQWHYQKGTYNRWVKKLRESWSGKASLFVLLSIHSQSLTLRLSTSPVRPVNFASWLEDLNFIMCDYAKRQTFGLFWKSYGPCDITRFWHVSHTGWVEMLSVFLSEYYMLLDNLHHKFSGWKISHPLSPFSNYEANFYLWPQQSSYLCALLCCWEYWWH